MTFLLTLTTYGTHLHGDPHGSIDRHQNQPCQPTIAPHARRLAANQARLLSPPFVLTEPRRRLVLESIQETCHYRDWSLIAAHVRTNNIHVIVAAEAPPESILPDLKAYASRRLNAVEGHNLRRWTRGGSTHSLPTAQAIQAATRCVIDAQGAPMSLYLAPEPPPSP